MLGPIANRRYAHPQQPSRPPVQASRTGVLGGGQELPDSAKSCRSCIRTTTTTIEIMEIMPADDVGATRDLVLFSDEQPADAPSSPLLPAWRTAGG
jgi:hypothetical protein